MQKISSELQKLYEKKQKRAKLIREREDVTEDSLVHVVEDHGGLCLKFVSPGNAGYPDRIVIMKGFLCFVETKSPTGQLKLLQIRRIAELESKGVKVFVVAGKKAVEDFGVMLDGI